MRFIFALYFVLPFFTLDTKAQLRILIVPLEFEQVDIGPQVRRMLKHNQQPVDSVRQKLTALTTDRLNRFLGTHELLRASEVKLPVGFADSLVFVNQENVNLGLNSPVTIKVKGKRRGIHLFSSKETHRARVLNQEQTGMLDQLIKEHKLDCVIFINTFKTVTKKPFSTKTDLQLSFEVYNAKGVKVYGTQSQELRKIKKEMYAGAFTFFVQNLCDELFRNLQYFLT